MPIAGVQAFAKCLSCGTVMWTEDRGYPGEEHQSCVCSCGMTVIKDAVVTGDADPSFEPTSLEELEAAEAQS